MQRLRIRILTIRMIEYLLTCNACLGLYSSRRFKLIFWYNFLICGNNFKELNSFRIFVTFFIQSDLHHLENSYQLVFVANKWTYYKYNYFDFRSRSRSRSVTPSASPPPPLAPPPPPQPPHTLHPDNALGNYTLVRICHCDDLIDTYRIQSYGKDEYYVDGLFKPHGELRLAV